MYINKARRDKHASGINFLFAGSDIGANCADSVAIDSDVADIAWLACAIDNVTIAYNCVVHK
jgi:hypothetical protein